MNINGKILFASDLHGRKERCISFLERIKEEKPDAILMAGDLIYYGPRNGIPDDLDEAYVREALKGLYEQGNFFSVKGNCDRMEDEIPFAVPLFSEIDLNQKRVALFHGHEESLLMLSSRSYDVYCFGHTHLYLIDDTKEGLFLNPGSLGFPKNGNEPTYMIIHEDWKIELHRLSDGKMMRKYQAFRRNER